MLILTTIRKTRSKCFSEQQNWHFFVKGTGCCYFQARTEFLYPKIYK